MHAENELLRNFYSSWAQSIFLYTRWADQHNISYSVLMTLYALYSGGSLTQKNISEYYGLPKQTVHSCVGDMFPCNPVQKTGGRRSFPSPTQAAIMPARLSFRFWKQKRGSARISAISVSEK